MVGVASSVANDVIMRIIIIIIIIINDNVYGAVIVTMVTARMGAASAVTS